jgi:hypothetical protein
MHCLFSAASGLPVRITDQPGDGTWRYIVDSVGIVAALGTLAALYLLYLSNEAAQRSADAAQEQVSAAWRPVLIPSKAAVTWFPSGAEPALRLSGVDSPFGEGCSVSVTAKNAGRGLALQVGFALRRESTPDEYLVQVSDEDPGRPDGQQISLLDEKDSWTPEVRGHKGPTDAVYLLSFHYQDLQGTPYSTEARLVRNSLDTTKRNEPSEWPLTVANVQVKRGSEALPAPEGTLQVLFRHPPGGEGGGGIRFGKAIRR